MTATEQAGPARRDGTTDDIAGLRIYYRCDGVEQHVDWDPNRGPTIAEAIAVKAATVSNVSVGRMLAVLQRSSAADDDPEALQGLVWLIRRFRLREELRITDLAGIDLLSLRQEYLDAQGVELDFPEDEPDEAARQLAADLAADIMRHLPTLDLPSALTAAASLVRAAPAADSPAAPGEDEAGDEPAPAQPDEPAATTPPTSKRSPRSGSPSSPPSTG